MLQIAILKLFIDKGICPSIIKKGRHILLIEVKENKIRFLTTNNYVSGNIEELAEQFEIHFEPLFFPRKFQVVENFFYDGKIPSVDYFNSWNDTAKKRKQIFLFHNEHETLRWNFAQKLIEFELRNLDLLAKSILQFLKESFHFQHQLQSNNILAGNTTLMYVNPFNAPLCSLGSFVFLVLKVFYLNRIPLHIVANEYGRREKNVSKLEHEFCSFMNFKFPEKKFQFSFNNSEGPKFYKESIPDLFSPVTNELFYFNGCYFHAHYDNCLINKKAQESTVHPFGKTYKEINKEFMTKIELLMKNHPEITKVTIQWECNFKKMKLIDDEMKSFFKENFLPHCLKRLKPRDAVRGAFSDVYSLNWGKARYPNESFYCTDVNGLYSFCAINFPFMIGTYKVLIGQNMENLKIRENKFFYNDKPVMGAILIKIVAPKDLFAPFLLYRKKNNSVVNTLCKICCETLCKKCNHSDEERSFIGTYMLSEIEFALQLNYKILQIFEAHVYESFDTILKDFIQKANVLKTLHSNCFDDGKDTLQCQQEYCNYLNERMKLNDTNFMLNPNNVTPNKAKRNFYKLLMNSLFGKFIQRSDQTEIKFINNQDQLEDIFFDGAQIEDFLCPNEHIAMLFIKKNVHALPPNRKINTYIGSQITAFARQVIYGHLQTLQNVKDCNIYQVECDSLYFSLPSNLNCPLPFSHAVGDFKIEYSSNILNFISLGPKHYSINFENSKGEIENISKFSGISLKNEFNQSIVNHETFDIMLQKFITKHEVNINLYQKLTRSDLKSMTVTQQFQKFTIRNRVSSKRFLVVSNDRLKTYPYGFTS